MRVYHCDLHGDRLIEPEVSTIRVSGPLAAILGRRELHVGKPGAYDLAEFFHHVVARPEGLESDMKARRKAEVPDDPKAARRKAIETGQAANSRPPRRGA